eukprot:3465850-Amphidinium_carterae.1
MSEQWFKSACRQSQGESLARCRLEAMVSIVKLSETGHIEAVEALTSVMDDTDWRLRHAGLQATVAQAGEICVSLCVRERVTCVCDCTEILRLRK